MTVGNAGPWRVSLVHRAARAACPRGERAWVDAMFAELAVIEAANRAGWALGAFGIVASVIRLRAVSVVPARLWWGIAGSLHAVVAFGIGSQTEIELAGFDDDVSMSLAWISGLLMLGLGGLAINRIFSQTGIVRRGRP